jgi:DNA sulfur modification protein DndE
LNTSMRLPDAVRIGARGREILIKLKRYTGIGQWNTLCRVAYCYSLAIGTEPTHSPEKGDIALEIEWPTFAGPIKTELAALTVARATSAAVVEQDLARYVRSHVERGLSALQNVRSSAELSTIASGAHRFRKLG